MNTNFEREWFPFQNYDDASLNVSTRPDDAQAEPPPLDEPVEEIETAILDTKRRAPPLQYAPYKGGLLITGDTFPYRARLEAVGANYNRSLKGCMIGASREAILLKECADLF